MKTLLNTLKWGMTSLEELKWGVRKKKVKLKSFKNFQVKLINLILLTKSKKGVDLNLL